jgi:hypothetical protein
MIWHIPKPSHTHTNTHPALGEAACATTKPIAKIKTVTQFLKDTHANSTSFSCGKDAKEQTATSRVTVGGMCSADSMDGMATAKYKKTFVISMDDDMRWQSGDEFAWVSCDVCVCVCMYVGSYDCMYVAVAVW